MGSIKRSFANNLSTGGVFTSSAITNASVTGITTLANAPADGITLISSQTASNSASISFTSGLTSTYKAYKFVFINMHPIVTEDLLMTNFSSDGGSNYNVTKTNTFFQTLHLESDAATQLLYDAADVAQSTGFMQISRDTGAGNDESCSGSLTMFNPSSTTYVKHFISDINSYKDNQATVRSFVAGYGNTTSAINAIQFKFSYGNIDTGTIYLYGIK